MERIEKIQSAAERIESCLREWEPTLKGLPLKVITERRNSQNRTIRQILGHLVDSAANNHHRIVRLQYVKRLSFPDYQPDNDTWIAIQAYQEKDWYDLIHLWKYYNIHLAWIIQSVKSKDLDNQWTDGFIDPVTLETIILGYPEHFQLHLNEIKALIEKNGLISKIGS